MFTKHGAVEVYIPQLEGFSRPEELEALERVSKAIPLKKWAFVQNCLPQEYSGILVSAKGGLERAREVREAGFSVIGYNLEAHVGVKELLDQCSAVALNIQSGVREEMLSLLSIYTTPGMFRIALGVNSVQEYNDMQHKGFDYFIGDFYTKAVISSGRTNPQLGPIQANKLAVLSEVTRWEQESKENVAHIAQIIQRDVYLTLSLIKMSNSAFFGSEHKISDLKDAIIRIGMENLTKWSIAILTAAITEDKTPEIARVALVRARFMENLAAWLAKSRWLSFFTGIASVSGIMLGESLETALKEMQAPPEILDYLNFTGDIGRLYGIVTSYISGDIEALTRFLENDASLAERLHVAYTSAELWVADILKSIDQQTLDMEKRNV
jgi:EAL and modified HD-GYP domain-containing signal transduction protein